VAHRTIVTKKQCLHHQSQHSTMAERFHTVIGKEHDHAYDRFDCEREKIFGSMNGNDSSAEHYANVSHGELGHHSQKGA
jgi:hypothetical protein